jgi:hypothetical protein
VRLGTADGVWITKYGFPFVEGVDGAGKFYRLSLRDGQLITELNVQPAAKYVISHDTLRPVPGFTGSALRVRDASTGETIGELISYGYGGGWAERFLAGFTGSGPGPIFRAGCGGDPQPYERIRMAVFEQENSTSGR